MSRWRIQFDKSAAKQFQRLSSVDQRRVRSFLDDRVLAAANPRALGTALTGTLSGLWRYRVGDIRIVVDIEDDVLVVYVVEVGNRREVYR